jgi:carbamoyl-phosphate synthase large subunit
MTRMLVTAAGGALAPLNIRLLRAGRRHKVEVVAVDVDPNATGRHFADAFETVPPGDGPGYVDRIIEIVRRHRVDIVLPWSDEEALALGARRTEVEAAGALLACADLGALEIMRDKKLTLSHLGAAGVPVPRWEVVETPATFDAALARLRQSAGEAVAKPLRSRGNRDTFVIRSDVKGITDFHGSRETHLDWDTFDAEFRAGLHARLPVIVMERLVGPVCDIDILARDGRIVRAVARERTNPAGIPFRGSTFRNDPSLATIAAGVARALGLSWLYDIDVMTDRDGRPVVIEVNPRPSGSIAASIVAGVPFYEDLIDLTLDREPPPAPVPPDGGTIVPYMDCWPSGAAAR